MGNTMFLPNKCVQCGSHDIALGDNGRDEYGDYFVYVCRGCGGKTYSAYHDTHAAFTFVHKVGKASAAIKALDMSQMMYTASEVKTVKSTYITSNPFAECDERELSEISVALGLLMEYPAAKGYLETIQSDLNVALANKG